MSQAYAQVGLKALLSGPEVRRIDRAGQQYFAVTDVVGLLSGADDPAGYWRDLKAREPALAKVVETADLPGSDGQPVPTDVVNLPGLLRLVQSIPNPRAERLKAWLARAAFERLQEAADPELAAVRARKLYERRGYSPRWVDKRLRAVSARHELTGEWYKRGAKASDEFRALTNSMTRQAFGMDVEQYRRHKQLAGTRENLRDHMNDLELALTALGETAAVALHRGRDSQGFDDLTTDVADAGDIVAQTRADLERRLGREVIAGADHGNGPPKRRPIRRSRRVSAVRNTGRLPGTESAVVGPSDPDVPSVPSGIRQPEPNPPMLRNEWEGTR